MSDTITLANDTFTGNATALFASTVRSGPQAVRYFNTLFVNNALGVSFAGGLVQTTGNNLLFGNTANYAGATDGPGYVKQDPHLDSTTPPTPQVGSPARGTADAAHAPASDYWGRARGSHPDIGAAQGQ